MTLRTKLLVPAAWMLLATSSWAADITVFAASSLKTALDEIATDWQARTGTGVVVAYDGSAKLARQIEQGASADLFISASSQWMDALQDQALIAPQSRRNILGNSLVLIASGSDQAQVTLSAGFDLAGLLGQDKLSMALVDSVPAGQYGKQALQSLGLWTSVEANVVQSENVRAALALVAMGEAPLGVVYASDAIAESERVSIIATFPADSHEPIVYPAALVSGGNNQQAADFLESLSSDPALAIFASQGFSLP